VERFITRIHHNGKSTANNQSTCDLLPLQSVNALTCYGARVVGRRSLFRQWRDYHRNRCMV